MRVSVLRVQMIIAHYVWIDAVYTFTEWQCVNMQKIHLCYVMLFMYISIGIPYLPNAHICSYKIYIQ